ncbi:hypothetical protein AVEN_257104-1 [Araneus ventricosus]|uniref:Uncharacterized protein n=1 Tax=Araneus ventricosus TaxID=182803 RepID=A0A4Y2FSX1_ARAVE|nr:hypothetical protein AVEN_257104-1 [Araneus ventricosus]
MTSPDNTLEPGIVEWAGPRALAAARQTFETRQRGYVAVSRNISGRRGSGMVARAPIDTFRWPSLVCCSHRRLLLSVSSSFPLNLLLLHTPVIDDLNLGFPFYSPQRLHWQDVHGK